ncbi:hypothetical protein [Chitinivorax sp. B]|uniref:hypothetical protein n=1 Tax=Chitinivorax sp. B TaxID=2502235 RepID=UPI0010F56DE6|nr:hypothetical protein [Chitinivorax sp. B]
MNHYLRICNALDSKRALAAEIQALDENNRAWIGVYPLDLSNMSVREMLSRKSFHVPDGSDPIYRIRIFEVRNKLIDLDEYICEKDIVNRRDLIIVGNESLFSTLNELSVNLEDVGLPYKCDYPL